MEQSPSSEPNSRYEIPRFYETLFFITVFKEVYTIITISWSDTSFW
jgi:hypothetical protein